VEQTPHDFGRAMQKARTFYHRKPASFKGREPPGMGACGYLVPLGFVPVVVCSTMPNRTCAERKTGMPLGYVTELQHLQ
jgi:hypothetical protein